MANSDDTAQLARSIVRKWIEEELSELEILERSEELQGQIRACVFEAINRPE